ncbi:MAG: NADH-quinone oxidoreductase subunit J [Deltaproteobacteria bacterium]|nr:NADH-quinone oxidoreductase subunit J [Deltaproteobacteria bacterium]
MGASDFFLETVFYAFVALTVFGGLLAVRTQILMYTVLGAAVAFLGVAGLFMFLGSLFLCMMQILIYLGAICIVLVFGIMVGYTPRQVAEQGIRGQNLLLAVPACIAAVVLLRSAVGRTVWPAPPDAPRDFSLVAVGRQLLENYALAFELISVLLLIAIIGAIIVVTVKEDPR